MNRIHHYCAIVHILLIAPTATAADGLSTNSFASSGTLQFGSSDWRQAAGSTQISSALQPGFKPLDNKVSEYIASTTNRVFGSMVAANRSAELAALIHPLAEPVQPLQRPMLDLNLVHAPALSTVHSPALVSPTGFQSRQSMFAPAAVTTPMGTASIFRYR